MRSPLHRFTARAPRRNGRPATASPSWSRRARPRLEWLEDRTLLSGEPRFITPLGGVPNRDWSIVNYVDQDPTSNVRDYRGGPFSYDGHAGIDMTIANFASMDAGVPVFAAAAGVVTYMHDGEPDRNTTMPDVDGNEVTIEHGGGWITFYGHFRKDSIAVVPGQSVAAGDFLGFAGSSGHSTAAHLHFEVQHNGVPVETYLEPNTFWASPLPYSGDAKGVLDFGFADHSPTIPELLERPVERDAFPQAAGQSVTFWAALHGLNPGDTLTTRWYRPNGTSYYTNTWNPGVILMSYWNTTLNLPSVPDAGTWQATYEINGVEVARGSFRVGGAAAPEIKVSEYGTNPSNIADGATSPVEFGTATPGGAGLTRTFTVRNTGNATLTLGTPTLPAGFTLVEGLSGSIAPYATDRFTVRLDTATAGVKSGQISFTTNDTDENPFNFSIRGVVAHTPTVFTVTNTNASGAGSLLDALYRAGAASGPATVVFQIPTTDPNYVDVDSGLPGGDAGPDVFIIRATTTLPLNNRAGGTTLDGASQAAFTGNTNPSGPEIVIDGSLAPYGYGVDISTTGNRLSGLTIQNFPWSGVRISGDSNVVAGNYIGTNATGTAAAPNAGYGVALVDGASGNRIGTDGDGVNDAAERNVISGNGWSGVSIAGAGTVSNVLAGNSIGTNAAGTAALGNLNHGVWINAGASGNRIGSDGNGVNDAAERNVISGNAYEGVSIGDVGTQGNRIAGNDIGTSPGGTADLGNAFRGVFIYGGAKNNTVGGTTAGARNVISGNDGDGVAIYNPGTSGNAVLGNYIGTNAAGTADLGNAYAGVYVGGGATGNTVGGAAAGARNVISGNDGAGVGIYDAGTSGNSVVGNSIGTNAAGTAALGNAYQGVAIASGASSNTVGGTASGSGNLLSGNGFEGVALFGAGTSGNAIQGNLIGTAAGGATPLGNSGSGIYIDASGTAVGGTLAGAGNVIAFNGGTGIYLYSGTMNAIRRNSIHSNAYLGIDLNPGYVTANDAGDADTGPNNLQNFPVVSAVVASGSSTTVTGTLSSRAGTTFTIEFFSSPVADPSGYGEGRTYLGALTVTTNASGNATFNPVLGAALPVGTFITATATDPSGNTSEFSAVRAVTGGSPTPSLAIGDVTVTEGDGGTLNATFTVTLSAASASAVTVQYATADGTATQPSDYTATAGTLTIPAGQLSRTIVVPIKGDTASEPTETFTVNLSGATGATIADGQGIGTILDNDPAAAPDIRMLSATADGAATLSLTYRIAGSAAGPFSIGLYRSADAAFGGDTLLSTVSVSAAADLAVGDHTLTFTIGGAAGQVKLPGMGAAESEDDDFILAVADPANLVVEADADAFNEDNTVAFAGAYHPAAGAVFVHGGAGIDAIEVAVSGTNLNLSINGVVRVHAAADVASYRVRGHGGNDLINGAGVAKPMRLWGGAGDDTLTGGTGDDTLEGGAGNDTQSGGLGNDAYLFKAAVGTELDTVVELAGGGVDRLDFAALTAAVPVSVNLTSETALASHAGRTVKTGAAGQAANLENATGGAGNDTLVGNAAVNVLLGGLGDDTLTGGLGNDSLNGGEGADVVVESADVSFTLTNTSLAGLGTDTLAAIESARLTGGAGNNILNAMAFTLGPVTLDGGAGHDKIVGGSGDDTLIGGIGNDIILGKAGRDTILGGDGRDLLIGGAGDDTIQGGAGDDILVGGSTAYDTPNVAAFDAILAAWTSTVDDYATRVAKIRAGTIPGGYRLNASTVSNDASAADILAGQVDRDWFITNPGDIVSDQDVATETRDAL